ncbi:hypothetical protein HUJ04_000652 [Dendroctonus ponderosae]|nr:hypothetical protein HUJ04_000652 [Dendroctonus ponderosae]
MVLNITASWLSRRICLFRSANKAFSSNASSLIPKNTKEPFISAHKQIQNGVVYDKKPMQLTLVAGKQYSWCLCGRSHNQPFCDGTHRMQELKITQKWAPNSFSLTSLSSIFYFCVIAARRKTIRLEMAGYSNVQLFSLISYVSKSLFGFLLKKQRHTGCATVNKRVLGLSVMVHIKRLLCKSKRLLSDSEIRLISNREL